MAERSDADAEFNEWLASAYEQLAKAARREGGRSGVAEDLLQDTLVALIQRRDRLTSPEMLLHYGLNLVRWRALDLWRRRGREDLVGGLREIERLEPSPRSTTADAESELAARQELSQQLSKLPPRSREIMELAMTGMTSVEIAHALGIEAASVRSLIRRARFQLATSKQGVSS